MKSLWFEGENFDVSPQAIRTSSLDSNMRPVVSTSLVYPVVICSVTTAFRKIIL